MPPDDKFWILFWLIAGITTICVTTIIAVAVVAHTKYMLDTGHRRVTKPDYTTYVQVWEKIEPAEAPR